MDKLSRKDRYSSRALFGLGMCFTGLVKLGNDLLVSNREEFLELLPTNLRERMVADPLKYWEPACLEVGKIITLNKENNKDGK